MEPLVIICIPYFNCIKYIKRAVLSILNQTYKNLKVVVINDADFKTPPWPELSDISDNRLIRFDLMQNKGPYFATQVLIEATKASYLLIQDADDWSHPERISMLIGQLIKNNSDFSFSTTHKFNKYDNSHESFVETLWPVKCSFKPDSKMRWIIPHWGIFKIESLKKIGGYYGGTKVGYDSFLTNLIILSGNITFVQMPLYHYYIRNDSLTNNNQTGFNSSLRRSVKQQLQSLYTQVFDLYLKFNSGLISSTEFINTINYLVKSNIIEEDKSLLKREISRIKCII